MDVQQNNTRERVFSILNNNDCPSFVIRQKQTSSPTSSTSPSAAAATTAPAPAPPPTKLPSISSFSPRRERPSLIHRAAYQRRSSLSSAGSPPLFRFDSSSSKSSNSSMDSTPSPTTPAYGLNDPTALPYDGLRPDLGTPYLASPTTITPYMEQHMTLAPSSTAQLPVYGSKVMGHMNTSPSSIYPTIPVQPVETPQVPTPSLSNHTSTSSNSSSIPSKTSPSATNGSQPSGKKNKYPCPYAASHNCLATFTTSGHAARHGKKHTGEKGVHCPVCNKAFTRKDNMKQHERTHKNNGNKNSDDTRSKAAITKDAQKVKSHKKNDSDSSTNHVQNSSVIQSPLSEAPSLAPNTVDTPINMADTAFYQDPSPPLVMVPEASLMPEAMAPSIYPPLGDETLMNTSLGPKFDNAPPLPPALIRGFSDLDTLAQAAESFDPYYQGQF